MDSVQEDCAFLASELSLTIYLLQQKMIPENNVLKNETHLIPNIGLPSV
jgi:hypothetical protein